MSPSSTPFPFIAGPASRTAIVGVLKAWLPAEVSVNTRDFSSSSTFPAASCTCTVVAALTVAAVPAASDTVATRLSAHEYWYLSNRTRLAGRACATVAVPLFQVWLPVANTGPEITRANGCPPASSRPSPSPAGGVSSPGSSRPFPFASSFGPLIPEICPATAPPLPRRTRTFQVPTSSWLGNAPLTNDDRCTASIVLRESWTGVEPRDFPHWLAGSSRPPP